jgi:hypothetical protein
MNSTITSGIGGSGESSGPDVTAIETVTVCTFDRKKGRDQKPICTIQRVRVLNNPPGKSDTNPPKIKDSPTPADGENKSGSVAMKSDKMCSLPFNEMTSEEEEAAMIDCMDKANEKAAENTPGPVQSAPQVKGRRMRRGD